MATPLTGSALPSSAMQSTTIPTPDPSTTLMTLPLEVRNMISTLALTLDETIAIRFPEETLETPQTTTFAALRFVNKQLYQETSPIFFASNTFRVGNGSTGYNCPSVKGFTKFIMSIPRECLSCITKVEIAPVFDLEKWGNKEDDTYGVDTSLMKLEWRQSQLSWIIDTMASYFPNLKTAIFDVDGPYGPNNYFVRYHQASDMASDNSYIMKHMVFKLLVATKESKLKRLEGVHIFKKCWLDLEKMLVDIVDYAKDEGIEAGKIVKLVDHDYPCLF